MTSHTLKPLVFSLGVGLLSTAMVESAWAAQPVPIHQQRWYKNSRDKLKKWRSEIQHRYRKARLDHFKHRQLKVKRRLYQWRDRVGTSLKSIWSGTQRMMPARMARLNIFRPGPRYRGARQAAYLNMWGSLEQAKGRARFNAAKNLLLEFIASENRAPTVGEQMRIAKYAWKNNVPLLWGQVKNIPNYAGELSSRATAATKQLAAKVENWSGELATLMLGGAVLQPAVAPTGGHPIDGLHR